MDALTTNEYNNQLKRSRIMVSKIPLHLRTRVVLVKPEMRFAYESPYAAQVPEVVGRYVTESQLKMQAQSNM
jgi:hypothetical protein